MRKIVLLVPLAALALVAASCGGAADLSRSPRSTAGAGAAGKREPPVGVNFHTAGWRTEFSRHSVPLGEISSGGPGKDGIPAIDRPQFEPVRTAERWLEPREPVIELALDGVARAYPLQILIWHEIVDDTVAGTPVAVTFCPLCNTALAFDRRLGGRVLEFGTTGNLRNSDLVMYDRQTESWWQQFGGEAIVGELTGKRLKQLPARIVAWRDFAREHPRAQVLGRPRARDGSLLRAYGQNPYGGYDDVDSPPIFRSANEGDKRLLPKERVVFLERGDEAVVISFSTLARKRRLELELGDDRLVVRWRAGARSALDEAEIARGRAVGSAEVRDARTGDLVAFDTPFWFAVAAFRPDIRVVRE